MRRLIALCIAAAWPFGTLAATDDVEVLHYEAVQDYVVSAAVDGAAKPSVDPGLKLRFLAFGRQFDLDLTRNVRVEALRNASLPPGVAAYRGTLAARPDSWVRIVTSDAGPTGLIWDGSTLYGLESPLDTAARNADVTSRTPLMFRLDDVYVAPGALTCAALAPAARSAAALLDAVAAEFVVLAQQGAALNLDIGAVADFEFQQIFGNATETALLARLNNVDGIFSEQLGVQISVAEVDVFTENTDPFTATDPEALLEELAIYRGATPAQDAQGLTHLFTGRDLAGTTAGIAYVGALCSRRASFDPLQRSFAVGLSEGTRGTVIDSLIAAHEIGHGFGAHHDAEAGSVCESTPPTFLMAPSVSGVDRFSQCSIDTLQVEIAAATCLTPIGAADLALTVASSPASALATVSFEHVLRVANAGAETAAGATLAVSVESGLELTATRTTAGECGVAGQTVSCDLGDLGGGAAEIVTLTLRGTAVGSFAIDAQAAAVDDSAPGNDAASHLVTIAPAVNLGLAANGRPLQTGQQTTLPVTLSNAADLGASTVLVAVTLTSGLRADSATLAGAACSIAGQSLSCPVQSLDARQSTTLQLTVTALVAGAQQVTLDASSAEAELAPADNHLLLAIGVTEPVVAAADGGGGAIAWQWLVALGLLVRARRRTRT